MNIENRNRVHKGVSTGGQFATEARSEASGVSLSQPRTVPRIANEVISSPLTLQEIGRRKDDEGRVGALIELRPGEMDTDQEKTSYDLGQKLAGQYAIGMSDLRVKPIGVTEDHQVICEVSADAEDLEEHLSIRENEEFQLGKQEAERGDVIDYESKIDASRHVDGSAFLSGRSELVQVPELPKGFESPEIEFGYNRHTDDPEVRIRWDQGAVYHQPSVDGYSDSSTEEDFADGVDNETAEELRDYAWCVGKNFITLKEEATSQLMKSEGFQHRMRELTTAGGNEMP